MQKIKFAKKFKTKKVIRYSIKLASIFAPSFISDSSLRLNIFSKGKYLKQNKIVVKQSYMILAWLVYLAKLGSNSVSNEQAAVEKDKKFKIPLFFVCPMKQTRITTLKAPMAHKTFSQEQFQFRFYTFSISFNLQNNEKVNNINTLNKSLFIALLIRNNFINFSTNMLFLKKFQAAIPSKDTNFLKI